MAPDPINGNKSGRSWNSQEKRQMLKSFMVLFFLSDWSVTLLKIFIYESPRHE